MKATPFDVRPIAIADVDALRAFFSRIPDGDKTFFKENVDDADTVQEWVADRRGRRLLAFDGAEVAGYVAVIPGIGWSDHVGELRLVVDPTRRRSGAVSARSQLSTPMTGNPNANTRPST